MALQNHQKISINLAKKNSVMKQSKQKQKLKLRRVLNISPTKQTKKKRSKSNKNFAYVLLANKIHKPIISFFK